MLIRGFIKKLPHFQNMINVFIPVLQQLLNTAQNEYLSNTKENDIK
jgi:hypothetical protein